MFRTLLSFLFPEYCLFCNKEGALVCVACQAHIVLSGVYACPVCNKENKDGSCCMSCVSASALQGHIAMVQYHHADILPQLIQQWKYTYNKEAEIYIRKYISIFCMRNSFPSIDIVVPVPLHHRRFAERGFNQAKCIATVFAKEFHVPLQTILVRKRYTSQQARLTYEKRLKNLEDAFHLAGDVHGKRILLVDDVFTTGTTMQECAKVLQKAGAISVIGFSIARG